MLIETLSKRGYRLIVEPTSARSVNAEPAGSAPLSSHVFRERTWQVALAAAVLLLFVAGWWWYASQARQSGAAEATDLQLVPQQADDFVARGETSVAETWYRRVLAQSPLHPEATRGIARLLRDAGNEGEARRLCDELVSRVGEAAGCDATAPQG